MAAIRSAKFIRATKLPPADWQPPTRADEAFYCFPLGCSGVRASHCLERQRKINRLSKEPKYPFCHELCEQGRTVRESVGEIPLVSLGRERDCAVRTPQENGVLAKSRMTAVTDPDLRDEIVDKLATLGWSVGMLCDASGLRVKTLEKMIDGAPVSQYAWAHAAKALGLWGDEE